jgi:hypothetical protein
MAAIGSFAAVTCMVALQPELVCLLLESPQR